MSFFDFEKQKPIIFNWIRSKESETNEIVSNRNTTHSLIDQATDWLERFKSKLGEETIQSLTTIFRLVRSWLVGDYNNLSKSTLFYIGAALLYCVSPVDVIPDCLLGIGLLDDVFVVGWTVQKISNELTKFRNWERIQQSSTILKTLNYSEVDEVLLCPGWLSEETDFSSLQEKYAQVYSHAKVLIFRWKSNVLWSEALQNIDSFVSDELVRWINQRPSHSNFVLVGHSLGGRLVIRALAKKALKEKSFAEKGLTKQELIDKESIEKVLLMEDNRKNPNQLESSNNACSAGSFSVSADSNIPRHVLLMGSAIDYDDADIETLSRTSTHCYYNFFNKTDRVLGYLYQSFEQNSPLGLNGLKREIPNFLDIKISGNEEYYWEVAANAASLLTFIKSKASLSKIPASLEWKNQFADYHQHQFSQYTEFLQQCLKAGSDNQK